MTGLDFAWAFEKIWVAIFAYIFWKSKELKKENKQRDTDIQNLQLAQARASTIFITETQMKEAVREALLPYKESQQEIKILLKGLNDHIFTLSKDVAVQHAIGALNNDK